MLQQLNKIRILFFSLGGGGLINWWGWSSTSSVAQHWIKNNLRFFFFSIYDDHENTTFAKPVFLCCPVYICITWLQVTVHVLYIFFMVLYTVRVCHSLVSRVRGDWQRRRQVWGVPSPDLCLRHGRMAGQACRKSGRRGPRWAICIGGKAQDTVRARPLWHKVIVRP